MADLLKKPTGSHGKIHDISPQKAGWSYVGFGLYHLRAGEVAEEQCGDNEVILVLVEGRPESAPELTHAIYERLLPHRR